MKRDAILLSFDRYEALTVDLVTKLVVWAAPLFTAILLYHALIAALDLDRFSAAIGAGVIGV